MKSIFLFICIFTASLAWSQAPLSGTVKETMNSGGYTYILLQSGQGDIWVATNTIPVKVGQQISLAPGMVMQNFTSKTLNRTFDKIVFSTGVVDAHEGHGTMAPTGNSSDPIAALARGGSSGSSSEKPSAMTSPSAMGQKAPAPAMTNEKIEKAKGDNSYSIAEAFEKAAQLEKKPVRIRGKVVKALPSIMGKNWIHIQDGTGDAQKGTHDLVFTSQDLPKVGDVVTFIGTLYTNKDFGAGYTYDVIVEEAAIVP